LALINLSDELNKQLPGITKLPTEFNPFPSANIVAGSARYFAEAYLGQSFLTTVYCQNYLLDSSIVTLFLSNVDGGAKLLEWSHSAEQTNKLRDAPSKLSFDEGKAIGIDDNYYGQIVTGIKGNRLVGIVGYSDEYQEFFDNWLNSLK
jgi:hypothetical protein